MNDQNLKELEREQADNKLINDAFQHLIDTYVASRHRKKVDIVTKAFNFARQYKYTSCTKEIECAK